METKRICTVCGKPLIPGAPEGLCPECLLKAGLGTGVDIGPDTGGKGPRFVPPKIEELAAKFPQLEILEFIGQGGMGAVYKTRQKQLDRVVALKILPPQAASGPAFAERFTREARALARLNHPHIVTLYEFGQADGLFYFLMEFVDGVNLRQLLNTSRIASREALAIVPQICEALQFAHDTGIVHRDIKPENILLDKKGQVKIADFGIAKLVTEGMEENVAEKASSSSDLTEAGSSLGTPQYMAPEQIKNSAEVDHRADIYSLGVVFYQMLTGELPSGKIEPPSKKVVIDVRLDEVVLRALEKKPELRYQQASDVKTLVETIATTPPPPATAPGWKHYKDNQFNFELDLPVGWNPFPPIRSNSPYEVIRFLSHENGKHVLILFRMPRDPKKSLKEISNAAQLVLTKAGFGNFLSGETTIGPRPAQILDFDRPQDGGTWSCREYFLAEDTLGYVLGFGTTDKAAMFETFECIVKSFQFQGSSYTKGQKSYFPSRHGSELLPFFPKPEATGADQPGSQPNAPTADGYSVRIEPNPKPEIPDRKLAFIKIPFVTMRDGKPATNWPVVLATGFALESLVLLGLVLGGDRDIPNVLDTRPIILIVLPLMALIPLWLNFEIRAGHNALAQGQPPAPLLSRRKKPLHRLIGSLLVALFIAFYLRTFLIAPYRVDTDSAAPEIPRGSQFLVWKLTRHFSPGDMIAYQVGNDVYISRVVREENDSLLVNKNGRPDTLIRRGMIVGKVISIYWRGQTPEPLSVLANFPQKLQALPTDEVFQAGLAQPQIPWAWMELKNRIAAGNLGAPEAEKIMTGLIEWMHHNYPNGYDQPLNSLGDLLEEMRKHNRLAETNMLAFLVASYGNPTCDPLPRVREGTPTLPLDCNVRIPWHDKLFGLQMLNEVRSFRIDNRPVSFTPAFQNWNEQYYHTDLQLPALTPGSHTVQCDIESALVPESDMAGLDGATPSTDWPPAKLRWTRFCQATFDVYPNDAILVTLSEDPTLNPVAHDAVSISQIIIRRVDGQLKAIANFSVNPVPTLPVSVDVTLRLGGQSVKCGSLQGWAQSENGSLTTHGRSTVLKADLDSLDPQIQEADVVLDPNPQEIESAPGVDRIWGHQTVIPHVPLKREDISSPHSYIELPFQNPGMEDGTNTPDAWKKGPPVKGVEQIWDHTNAHNGHASLGLKKTTYRFFPIAQWSQDISIEPQDQPRKLRVRCWVKAQNVTKAIVDVNYNDGQDQHVWAIYIGQRDNDPLANFDWKLCEETVEVPAHTSNVGIAFEIYGPGEVWFDDLDVAWEVPVQSGPAQSKRQQFEPATGMEGKTSWGVVNHSEFNTNGWAVLANMTLDGMARITPGMLYGKMEAPADQLLSNDVCRIKLVGGNDDQVTLDVDDLKWNKDITLKLNRDQWADLTINGINYKVGYCSVWVAPDKPDSSPFANIVVTHSEAQH